MYGRIRLGGTIGWGLFAPIAGALVLKYGLNIAFWVFAGIMFLNLLVSQKFSFGKLEEHASDHGGVRTLLMNRRWVIFLLFAFLGGVGAFSVASYLYPYMAELGAEIHARWELPSRSLRLLKSLYSSLATVWSNALVPTGCS